VFSAASLLRKVTEMRSVTAFLAWWGAVISTAVLVWDVYKWQKTSRPRLVVNTNGDFQDLDSNNPQKYVSLTVTNIGDKPTTLNLVTFKYYATKPKRWRKQNPDKSGVFLDMVRATAPLPHKLDVGTEWSGLVFQTEELEKLARSGYFYVHAEDSTKHTKSARSRFVLE